MYKYEVLRTSFAGTKDTGIKRLSNKDIVGVYYIFFACIIPLVVYRSIRFVWLTVTVEAARHKRAAERKERAMQNKNKNKERRASQKQRGSVAKGTLKEQRMISLKVPIPKTWRSGEEIEVTHGGEMYLFQVPATALPGQLITVQINDTSPESGGTTICGITTISESMWEKNFVLASLLYALQLCILFLVFCWCFQILMLMTSSPSGVRNAGYDDDW